MKLLWLFVFFVSLELNPNAINVEGTAPRTVNLYGKETIIQVGAANLNARRDVATINSKDYKFGPTWSVFELSNVNEIKRVEWNFVANCAAQMVGTPDRCQVGYGICQRKSTNEQCWVDQKTITYWPLQHTTYWCWKIEITGATPFNVSELINVATVSLFEYGGPNTTSSGLGWSLQLLGANSIEYEYHAAIKSIKSRTEVSLSTLRYVQDHGIVPLDTYKTLIDSRPPEYQNISYNSDYANCFAKTKTVLGFTTETTFIAQNFTTDYKRPDAKLDSIQSFTPYYLTRKAAKPMLLSLIGERILTHLGGTDIWESTTKNMNYFDPCQRKFLRLKLNDGVFSVEVPQRETLIAGKPLCIGIQDGSEKNNLVLYALGEDKRTWKASNEFIGILTLDYIESVELSVTTTSNIIFDAVEGKVDVIIEKLQNTGETTEIDMTVISNKALKCTIEASQTCTELVINVTPGSPQKKRISHCYPLFHKGNYNCNGVSGEFYPPSVLTQKAAVQDTHESRPGSQEQIPQPKSQSAEIDWGEKFKAFFSGISDFLGLKTFWDKVRTFGIIAGIVILILYFRKRRVQQQELQHSIKIEQAPAYPPQQNFQKQGFSKLNEVE